MNAINRVLFSLRDKILEWDSVTRALKKPVSAYRSGIYYVGPDKKRLSIENGPTAVFHSETREEIRHFYPIYGELDNLSSLLEDLQPNDVFYDIGSHVGIYSCIAAQIISPCQVFAFEPHPLNVSRLNENADLNGMSIQIFERALSDTNEKKQFSIDTNQAGAVGHSDASVRGEQIEVDFVRGAEFIEEKGIPHPTVIKLDIEGAELAALRGLDDVLDDCRLIYCEVSDHLTRYGDSKAELLQFLRERDYQIEPLGSGTVQHEDIRAIRS